MALKGVQMVTFAIKTGYVPGCIGRVTELHGLYYAKHWNFGAYFEGKVAIELADLMNRYDPTRDGLWTAWDGDVMVGSIAIDGQDADGEGARLRWFIIDERYQGQGLGRRLLDAALGFCRACGFRRVYLTTFAGLDTARALYERNGFRLREQEAGSHWGTGTVEQKFELMMPPSPPAPLPGGEG